MRLPRAQRGHPLGMGGTQKIFRFSNGYGASVIQFPHSYGADEGLWELAVIRFTGDGTGDFSIVYNTSVTDDVVGYLTEAGVDSYLDKIEALEKPE